MRTLNTITPTLPILLLILVAVGTANDDLVVEDDSSTIDPSEIEEANAPVGQRNVGLAGMRIRLDPEQENLRLFEQQIFPAGGSKEKSLEKASYELKAAIRSLDSACHLSDLQKEKLTLAGHADQKRFTNRFEAIYASSQSEKILSEQIIAEMLWLRTSHDSGLLGCDSFFAKAIRHTLTSDQLAAAQRAFVRVQIEKSLRVIEDYITLEDSQRQSIVATLIEASPAPEIFWKDAQSLRNRDVLEMKYRFSTVAETRIKPLLTTEQWIEIQSWLEDFRRSHDAMLFEEGRVVPGSNELAPNADAVRTRKKLK